MISYLSIVMYVFICIFIFDFFQSPNFSIITCNDFLCINKRYNLLNSIIQSPLIVCVVRLLISSLDFQLKLYKVFFNININKHHTALFGNKFVVVASSHGCHERNNFYCILQFE